MRVFYIIRLLRAAASPVAQRCDAPFRDVPRSPPKQERARFSEKYTRAKTVASATPGGGYARARARAMVNI